MMQNKRKALLGIDTSNYTTSAAISIPDRGQVNGGFLVCQEKQLLSVKEGERGLRQSDAVFAHTVNLPAVIEKLFSEIPEDMEIAGIGYSARPRDLEGSYMPCFLAGESVARSLGAAMGIPVYSFSHQAGHIAAASYSADNGKLTENPFLAFHVSGGTTDLLYVIPRTDGNYDIRQIGTSLDLNAGQAIDRIGVRLGLTFPCGRALEQLAAAYTGEEHHPKTCVRGCDCNLSGLENMTLQMLDRGCPKEEIAAFAFTFIKKTLGKMTKNALTEYPHCPVLFAGGVMSNRIMRAYLSALCEASFAEPAFSADNAAGISILACRRYGLSQS